MANHMVLYQCNETVFRNKNRWTIDTHNNMSESQKYYIEWKKKALHKKSIYTVWFHICSVLEQAKLLYYENIRRADASQRWRWRLAGKGREGTFWNDGNVLYFDRSLGQNWENGAFKVCMYIHFTSKKKKKLNGKWKLVNKMYAEAFQGNTDICI